MTDVLRAAPADLHGNQFGEFTRRSRRLLEPLPRAARGSFEKSWSTRDLPAGRSIHHGTTEVSATSSAVSDDKMDSRIISRWEDDGGHIPPGLRSAGC